MLNEPNPNQPSFQSETLLRVEDLLILFDRATVWLGDAITIFAPYADRSDLAVAFVAGAVALAAGARISVAAAVLVIAAFHGEVWGLFELDSELRAAVAPVALLLFLLGLLQGAVSLVAGRAAASTIVGAILIGVVVVALWRGPIKILRTLTRFLGGH